MENYQMFFPCSSSSSPDMAAAPFATNSMQPYNNFHGHGHVMSSASASNIGGGRGGFFLGLDSLTATTTERNLNNHGGVLPNNRAEVKEVCQMSDENKQEMKYNKKGEKKIRKPKFAFQTRSQVDILDDGYRWRKYGQKAVKNNKFPRSYYRCTQQGCNVKKQVQRLTKDEAIVVTTYEGMHTHPIDKPTDNFEHILSQMQVYTPF